MKLRETLRGGEALFAWRDPLQRHNVHNETTNDAAMDLKHHQIRRNVRGGSRGLSVYCAWVEVVGGVVGGPRGPASREAVLCQLH